MKPITVAPESPSVAFRASSGVPPGAKVSMSTALGITVTRPAAMPRETMSRRSPSQMVNTWSARRNA